LAGITTVTSDVVPSVVKTSVAFRRPTFASSVYYDPLYGGAFSASKAVDGNKNSWALTPDNSCFVSNYDNNPWWAVDLGLPVAVAAVNINNRGDCCGNVSTLSSFITKLGICILQLM